MCGTNRRDSRRRRGYVLVFFLLLVFAIMAIAALVIDIGLARLTQRQMQTAVNTAALEGLRGRDRDDVADPELSRRQAASDMVVWTFDDDFDLAGGDARNFGAGPAIELSGGAGDPTLAASQLLTIPDPLVYKPRRGDTAPGLELNNQNASHGDMLSGEYLGDHSHAEDSKYSRADFDTASANLDSFLVRMRRTNDFQSLDNIADVSSSGSTIPYLFGRGTLIPMGDPSLGYSPRHHGMTIRATTIATARSARSVGSARPSAALPGELAITIRLEPWTALAPETLNTIRVSPAGDVQLISGATTSIIGIVTEANGQSTARSLGATVGQVVPAGSPAVFVSALLLNAATVAGKQRGFVPILGNVAAITANQLVGFGLMDSLTIGPGPDEFSFIKRTRMIAAENAAAVPFAQIDETLVSNIEADHQLLQDSSLLAPALVR